MPKIKLLLLITQSVWGGAQKYVYDLATNLPREFEVTVAAGSGGELIPELRREGVRVVEIPELVRPVNPIKDIQALGKIYHLIKKEKFDIVHTNSSKAGLLGRLAGRLVGVRAVTYTVHGLVLNEPLNPLIKGIYWLMEWVGARCSDSMIAVSEIDRHSVVGYHLKNQADVTVIPVGVDPFQTNKDEHQGLVIGTVANFFPTKGYRYYFPAVEKILETRPGVRFEIVGIYGPDKEWVDREVKRLGNRVTIVTSPDSARSRLGDFGIFVLPSVKEGMPYTVIEAMIAGLPIIATRVGGVPEEIVDGKSGILVEPENSAALSEAMEKLISDPKLRTKLGEQAKIRATEFTLNKMVEKTVRFYQGLLT